MGLRNHLLDSLTKERPLVRLFGIWEAKKDIEAPLISFFVMYRGLFLPLLA